MKVTKEKLDNYELALTIEIEADKLAKAKKTACKSLANRYNFPGFRKGKAPQHIVEQQLGKEFVMEEAADILIQETASEALKEEGITPVTEMKPEVITNEEGKDFVFKVTFTPYPEVKLGEYKGLKIEKKVDEVTDEDVDKQLEVMRDHHATLVDTDENAVVEDGDFITLDFEGFIDGEAFEGGVGKSHPLTIGSGTFIPGFEEGLIGTKVNEERDINVTFPEDYHSQEFAGKDATFKCKVLSIKHRELPELNEEFVKKVSKFETLEDFKADIRKNMESAAKHRAEDKQHRDAVEKAAENITVDIPPVMIENRISQLINELSLQLQTRGMTFESYLQYTGYDMDHLRESYKEAAEKDVRDDLMLEAVAKQENIEVDPKEVEYEIAVMAATYRVTPKQIVKILKENRQLSAISSNVRRRKAMQFIIDNMVKDETEEKPEKEEKRDTKPAKEDKKTAKETKSEAKSDKTDKAEKAEKTDKK